ncbi:MAG: ParA family protein [Myxococcales bacterium]|jgi:chromosome partitioning protein|nr:ParA family protein [Myxococcales bacterium]
MARRIVLTSQKGGVGKTTVALNLALAFAERGKRTLLVDLDPQGGIGHALARGDTELVGLTDLLMGQITAEEAVLPTRVANLTLLPRGRLDPAEVSEYELALASGPVLRRALDPIDARFDLTLIDTPSGVGIVTRAALGLADYALIPFQAEALALRSLSQVLRAIDRVRAGENPRLEMLGIVPTMVDRNDDSSLAVMNDVWSGLWGVTDTSIPRAAIFARASLAGLPVGFLAGRPPPEARRFDLLAAELEGAMDEISPRKEEHHDRPARALL